MSWRFSIGRLMVLTGVVAVNLAVVAAMARAVDLPVATYTCGPILLGVQFALHRSVVGCRARRPFWLGFAAAGAVAVAALFWAYFCYTLSHLALSAPMRSSGTGSTGSAGSGARAVLPSRGSPPPLSGSTTSCRKLSWRSRVGSWPIGSRGPEGGTAAAGGVASPRQPAPSGCPTGR